VKGIPAISCGEELQDTAMTNTIIESNPLILGLRGEFGGDMCSGTKMPEYTLQNGTTQIGTAICVSRLCRLKDYY
jgi:hypothetical protein